MPTRLLARTLLLLAALSGGSALAQFSEVVTVMPNLVIPDDAYDGTLASMACADLVFTHWIAQFVSDVRLDLGVEHTWIGDLTVKVRNPLGSVLTVLNRPGLVTPDDGSGCCGDSSDLASAFPVSFYDEAPDDAELMGLSIPGSAVVCRDDGQCDFFPSPQGAAGPTSFSDGFFLEPGLGTWQVCIGDSVSGDEGLFASAALEIFGLSVDCFTGLSATVNTTHVPASGGQLTFTVRVTNFTEFHRSVDLWLGAFGEASVQRRLGSGTLPPYASVEREVKVNVPASTPDGTHEVYLFLGRFESGSICDYTLFTITKGETSSAQASSAMLVSNLEVADDFFSSAVSMGTRQGNVEVQPNPFRDRAALRFALAAPADVRLAVYDVLGCEVAVLVDGPAEAGAHAATFYARGLAAGTYVYRLTAGGAVQTGRLTLTR